MEFLENRSLIFHNIMYRYRAWVFPMTSGVFILGAHVMALSDKLKADVSMESCDPCQPHQCPPGDRAMCVEWSRFSGKEETLWSP